MGDSMERKLVYFFSNSAGVLLLAGALALFVANLSGAGQVQLYDPVFSISMKSLFWIAGAISLAVAMICLFGKALWLKTMFILWLALNGLVYGIGCLWNGNHGSSSAYLTGPAQTFGVTPDTAYWMLEVALLYLLAGSLTSLLWLWWSGKNCLKMVCAHCGGRIQFSVRQIGQQIPCPHCRVAITLRKPDENLKMTCVLCGGHVEFPAHALGQKIPCPHCAKTITLLQPA